MAAAEQLPIVFAFSMLDAMWKLEQLDFINQ